jgi:hypothetical protein
MFVVLEVGQTDANPSLHIRAEVRITDVRIGLHVARVGRCAVTTESLSAIVCWLVKPVGKPDAGNPHVRFDEGERGNGARSG